MNSYYYQKNDILSKISIKIWDDFFCSSLIAGNTALICNIRIVFNLKMNLNTKLHCIIYFYLSRLIFIGFIKSCY
jgi:hypothetical protein